MKSIFRIYNNASGSIYVEESCRLTQFPPQILAVTETFLQQADIPERIVDQFDIVYGWLKESGLSPAGHNHALYDQFGEEGMRMRVGVPVAEAFADTEQVQCLHLPELKVAHYRHQGAYSCLAAANLALNEWCVAQRLDRQPLSIEVYGDWQDDEAQLVTDVYLHVG